MCFHTLWQRRCWSALIALAVAACAHAQADGSRKWVATLSAASTIPGNILSSPALSPDGTIYVGTEVGLSSSPNPMGRLVAVTPSGTIKWRRDLPDWVDSTPAVASDGTIYVGCWDGNLYATNADGSAKWACPLGTYISGSPALGADGTIYIGTGGGDLYAVNPDGSVKWFFPALYWIEGSPAVGPDGTIYFGSDDNSVYAVRPDGTEKWHYTTGNDVASSPAIAADGTVYIGSRDLKLYAFRPDGTVKWTFETTDMIDASPVLGADGTVYCATVGGLVFALTPNGTQKWQYPAATQPTLGSIYSTPAVRADGTLVFGSSDNAVYALKSDGTLLWKAAVGDWTDSSPCVAPDGTIYIGCTDKSLYAFNGKSALTMTDWPQLLRNPQRTGYQPLGAPGGTTGRLMNLSVRTLAGAGSNTLIAGFYVGGSGTRNLLVRGTGPALTTFGITGVLPDPQIAFFPSGSGTATQSNDNWSQNNTASPAVISSTGDALGAFPLPANSLDSALLLGNFAAGGGSVQVTGANGSTGIALLELYDAGGSSTARLINLSARSFVDTGAGVLIAGFVVDAGTRAVLIRGVGPTLAKPPFNLGGVVATPQLQVFRSANGHDTVVAENAGWSTATNAAAISAAAEGRAFPLATGSADCAMLLTLPPGNYSCQVSGLNSTTGIGMVEVYEIP